jgi:hypothetical protein
MNTAAPAEPQHTAPWRTVAVAALVFIVAGIVAVAFRGSWGALQDAALAAHFDRDGAFLYGFAVDGLLIVVIIAGVLLRHDDGARRYCLVILVGYTGASWLINYLHGLGMFSPDPVTHVRPGPPWLVVGLIAALLIGSIFLGSHLLIFVCRHVFPDVTLGGQSSGGQRGGTDASQDDTGAVAPPKNSFEAARIAYRKSLPDEYVTLSQKVLSQRFGINVREAARVQSEVKAELESVQPLERVYEPDAVPSQNGQGPA